MQEKNDKQNITAQRESSRAIGIRNMARKELSEMKPLSNEVGIHISAKEYRCPGCNRLLMRGKVVIIETRCPRCKKVCLLRE